MKNNLTKKNGSAETAIKEETAPAVTQGTEETAKTSRMEELLDKITVTVPKLGELVKGEVIEIAKNAIYLDLGILGTGIVMGREMKDGLGIADNLKKGDEIEATVISLENEDGYMELSLREAGYEKTWDELERKLKEGDIVSTKILAANRGGLMVEINGVTGFLPVSQLSNENYPRVEDGDKNKILQLLNQFVDKNMDVRIIDVDRDEEKLIVSEKATLSEKEQAEIKKFQLGDVITGVVSGIVDFGVFVKFPPKDKTEKDVEPKAMLEGLVHISELAWQLIENPRDIVKVGEKVQCKIIGVEETRISLSIRALKTDPWSNVNEKYRVGEVVKGEITKFNPFGAFVQLDQDIHGLAHISELNRFAQGKNIESLLQVGEKYDFKILSIDSKNHRMGLSPLKKEAAQKLKTEQAGASKSEKEVSTEKKTKSKKAKPAAEKGDENDTDKKSGKKKAAAHVEPKEEKAKKPMNAIEAALQKVSAAKIIKKKGSSASTPSPVKTKK